MTGEHLVNEYLRLSSLLESQMEEMGKEDLFAVWHSSGLTRGLARLELGRRDVIVPQ